MLESTDPAVPVDDPSLEAPTARPRRKSRKRKTKGEVRLRGVEHLFDEPADWTPLLELVGVGLAQAFMDMGRKRLEDGTILHLYKHRHTRAYIHLTADGRAFYYDWDGQSLDDGPHDFVETTRFRVVAGAFRDFRDLWGYDEGRDQPLIDRALDVASQGLRLPVDPRYAAAYARATALWREVEQLAEEIGEEEREEAREEARQRARAPFDDDGDCF